MRQAACFAVKGERPPDSIRQNFKRVDNLAAGTLDDDQIAQAEYTGIVIPRADLQKLIPADDKKQIITRKPLPKCSDRVDGI